jgi:hypothetical protein
MTVVLIPCFNFGSRGERDGMKHCRKMKRMQQTHLDSIERKRDTSQQCDDIGQRKCGTEEGKRRK